MSLWLGRAMQQLTCLGVAGMWQIQCWIVLEALYFNVLEPLFRLFSWAFCLLLELQQVAGFKISWWVWKKLTFPDFILISTYKVSLLKTFCGGVHQMYEVWFLLCSRDSPALRTQHFISLSRPPYSPPPSFPMDFFPLQIVPFLLGF